MMGYNNMNVLGIHHGHDSSMCLLKNGRIKKYFLNERISGVKHDGNIDNELLKSIFLKYKIDAVAISCVNYSFLPYISGLINKLILNDPPTVYNYSEKHHLCHASISYHNSGFNDALCIVIDGYGNLINSGYSRDTKLVDCESIYLFNRDVPKLIYKNLTRPLNYPDYFLTEVYTVDNTTKFEFKNRIGIGQVYEVTSVLIGNSVLDCGKSMGLSSYGKFNKKYDKIYEESNTLNNDFFVNPEIRDFLMNPVTDITPENYKEYADFCYAVQNQTQQAVGDMVEEHIKDTGVNNVCLSGGYAMNVVANYYLLKRFPNLNFYFEPVCSDSGNSIGAAMDLYQRLRKFYHPKVKKNITTAFHGNSYRISKEGNDTNLKEVSKLLYSNNSVGVFNGKAEAGQRALGNRSILFNALNPNGKEIVNSIKKREWYRPFAAIVLEEDASLYFDVSLMPSSPFMTVAFPVVTDLIPSVTHVDNTCRVQTVTNKDGYLYKLLREFKKLSGHGVLLNTSMNLAGQPLVETPEDAIRMLNSSELEYLYFPQTNQIFTNDSLF